MYRNIYFSILCISLLFIFILGGCSDKSQEISKTTKFDALPAVEISDKNIIIPQTGISLDTAKDLAVKYLCNMGVKGDIQSNLTIDEITIKEAWENLGIQLFKIRLDYAVIHGIAVVKDGQMISLLHGMPIFEAFLADIDGDGKYEIYANVAFGSGIVSDDISGYNIATNTNYHMSRRAEKNFKLFLKENTLLVKVLPYGNLEGSTDEAPDIKALKIEKGKLLLRNPNFGFAVYKVKEDSIKKAKATSVIEDGTYKVNKNIDLSKISSLFESENKYKLFWQIQLFSIIKKAPI